MTSRTTTLIQRTQDAREFGELPQFPDYPPRDDMQNYLYLYRPTVGSALTIHLERIYPNVTVSNEVPMGHLPVRRGVRIPDLAVMIDGDFELMKAQRGYEIDKQGKAPDFVLEVASVSTGVVDYRDKRRDYARFGVLEYWRFDPSGGNYHDAALAGDLLVDGRYEPIAVEEVEDGLLRGYSNLLQLYVCWGNGELKFYDPKTASYLPTHIEDRMAREAAESRVEEERAARMNAELQADAERARAEQERAARESAEARVAEMEAELRRLRGE